MSVPSNIAPSARVIPAALPTHRAAVTLNRWAEGAFNRAIRGADGLAESLGLGGRKAKYDDGAYCFLGGPAEELRGKHYDKSLRLLWKAEESAPWTSFHDGGGPEKAVRDMAKKAMSGEGKRLFRELQAREFRDKLKATYTLEQRRALARLLSAIGHGEAYAWLVSAELLGQVQSTGAKAAVTMQVLEEAKHFVVLRELCQAFDVEIPRQSGWEYLLMEQVLRAEGLEKFFGMNILIEGIAVSMFGILSSWPHLEILKLFHLDESRHTALPVNYFKEFPMTWWQRSAPLARLRRMAMILPAVPMILELEETLATLGIDVFHFGATVMEKIASLAERSGFLLPLPAETICTELNRVFNAYCALTRPGHRFTNFRDNPLNRQLHEHRMERLEVA